jgi:hypothetical protein
MGQLTTRGRESPQGFHEQLFDVAELLAAGDGWILVDPRRDSAKGARNRERIAGLIRRAEASLD